MFEVRQCYSSSRCFIFYRYVLGYNYYLLNNGLLGNALEESSLDRCYWNTKQEAQDFLNKWLPKGAWSYSGGIKYYQILWLTPEHIQKQAKLGDKEALDCSIEHWKQVVVAGWNSFYKTYEEKRVNIYADYCALCRRFKLSGIGVDCYKCPVTTKAEVLSCTDTPHKEARVAFEKRDKQAFESAAVEELNFLIELRNELFGNPYLEKEKMSDKMIDVRGKKISEDTIVEALQKHCGFKDRLKQYTVEVRKFHGCLRVVIRLPDWVITRIKEKGIKSFVLDPMCIQDSPKCSPDRNKDYTENNYLSKQIEYAIGEIKDE